MAEEKLELLRVLKPIRHQGSGRLHQRGEIVRSDAFSATDLPRLLQACAVSIVRSPPLTELRGWDERAPKLAEIGVTTVAEFLLADDEALQEALEYRTRRSVERLKSALMPVIRSEPFRRG